MITLDVPEPYEPPLIFTHALDGALDDGRVSEFQGVTQHPPFLRAGGVTCLGFAFVRLVDAADRRVGVLPAPDGPGVQFPLDDGHRVLERHPRQPPSEPSRSS